jgi:hypothetical protein
MIPVFVTHLLCSYFTDTNFEKPATETDELRRRVDVANAYPTRVTQMQTLYSTAALSTILLDFNYLNIWRA